MIRSRFSREELAYSKGRTRFAIKGEKITPDSVARTIRLTLAHYIHALRLISFPLPYGRLMVLVTMILKAIYLHASAM